MENKNVNINGEWLTIKNYKEPLKAILKADGYGYYGTLLASPDGKYVQCAACGNLYQNLSRHILNAHKDQFPSVRHYREKYELAFSTALVSETERVRLKKSAIAYFLQLSPSEVKAFALKAAEEVKAFALKAAEGRRNRGNFQPKMSLETKNKRGTCPDQLLDKIQKVADKIGRVPSLAEFMQETGGQRFKGLIYRTFGSWNNALKMLKMTPRDGGTREAQLGRKKKRYTNDELIESLRIFTQENQSLPTSTDSKRGFIPSEEIYKRRFGSLPKAREFAHCKELIN